MRKSLRAALIALVIGFSSLVPATGAAAPPGKGEVTHEVAEGQSLWKIAKRYNVSVRAIELANKLDGGPIKPGTVLKIPSGEEAKKLETADKKSDKDKKSDAKKSDKDDEKAVGKKADEKADKKKADDDAPGLEKRPPDPAAAPHKWWLEPPNDASQTQKNPDERGGVNPCNTKDMGFGIYDGWKRSPSMGQMILPARGGVTKDGKFDVVFHFHGHEPARKEFVKVMDGAVLVGIDLGIGSGAYSSGFASPQTWNQLLASVERGVADARGIPSAKARKIGLSAWSAGYGAVEMILRHTDGKTIDSVILLDGLHSGYGPGGPGTGLDEGQLAPFLAFARSAKAGKKLMYVSHSSIIPPGYASTTETANWLVMKLGGKPKRPKGKVAGPWGLEENARWDAGNFHMRGYDGNDKMDHCAHFGLMKDVLKVHIKPRWSSPKGHGPKKETPKTSSSGRPHPGSSKDPPKKPSTRT